MDGNFNNFQEVLDILHDNDVKYLVLRNYDNLLLPEMYQDGHGDVDMLCENSEYLANLIGAKYYTLKNGRLRDDKTHFFIVIYGQKVSLDLRQVGDGYYCEAWERNMLKNRILHNGFYIMNKTDLFYSLTYHAILQKPSLSAEYKSRLNKMSQELHITGVDIEMGEKSFIRLLDEFMRQHGYRYTYPKDKYVRLRTSLIDNKLIEKNSKLKYTHWRFDTKIKIIEFLVSVKHRFERCLR